MQLNAKSVQFNANFIHKVARASAYFFSGEIETTEYLHLSAKLLEKSRQLYVSEQASAKPTTISTLPLFIDVGFRLRLKPLRLEYRVVLFDKLVKEGPFRTMALVSNTAFTLTGFPASRHLQHDRVPAMWMSLSLPNDLESSTEIGRAAPVDPG